MAKISKLPKNLKLDKSGPKLPDPIEPVKFVETIAKKPKSTSKP